MVAREIVEKNFSMINLLIKKLIKLLWFVGKGNEIF